MSRHRAARVSLMPQDFAAANEKGRSRLFDTARLPSPSADARFLVLSIVCAALVTSSLVFWVWVKMAQVQAGYRVHELQRELVQLRQERSALRVEVAALKRHDRLHRLSEGLGLHAPPAEDVIRIQGAASMPMNTAKALPFGASSQSPRGGRR